jgi:hypothetical protein
MRQLFSMLVMALCVALAAPALVGCGPSKPPGKTANVKPGEMPMGGDFEGVWFNPLFGFLHLETEGNRVRGRWLRPRKDQWGELKGNIEGNLLRFDWSEYIHGLVGPNSSQSGKGYFVYQRPEGDNVDDVIAGEVGRGDDEIGTPWEAIKQRNVKPNVDSIGGAGAPDVGGGDWDSDNSESGQPESPVEPESEAPEL